MSLYDVFDLLSIKPKLESPIKAVAFMELAGAIAAAHPRLDRDAMFAAVQNREWKMNTAVAPGIALPHGYCPGAGGVFGALGISPAGIDYGAPDHRPVHCVFLLIMDESSHERHLRVLKGLARLIDSGGGELLLKAQSPEAIHGILSRFLGTKENLHDNC